MNADARIFLVYSMLLCAYCAGLSSEGLAQTCHVLMLGATGDSEIGESVRVDLRNFREVFVKNIPPKQLHFVEIKGDSLTPTGVSQAIDGVANEASSNDTIVVYYSGHGAYSSSQGHFLNLPTGRVFRSEIREQMYRRQIRLWVLMTDCCSAIADKKPAAGLPKPQYSAAKITPAFQSLFYDSRGMVDICGSAVSEVAMGDDTIGGYFTNSLVTFLDSVKQNRISWDTLIGESKTRTQQLFLKMHPGGVERNDEGPGRRQMKQTVVGSITDWPESEDNNVNIPDDTPSDDPNPGGPRFGVRVKNNSVGVRVTEVLPGHPGSRVDLPGTGRTISLEPGDVIVTINGREITNEDDYSGAIDQSGQRMRFEVINLRDGIRYAAEVTMRY